MSIEHIKLSHTAKYQLLTLKRRTKIEHWNVLCRWSFCLSLAEPNQPPKHDIPSDSNVEMTWRIFGGQNHEIFLALLKERCLVDELGTEQEILDQQFRLHLHRGIGYLVGMKNLKSISDLISLPLDGRLTTTDGHNPPA